jgi:pimeloyl-ACP methyl ester carboxylesterase
VERGLDLVKMLVYLAAFLLRDGEVLLSVAGNDTESLVLPNLVMSEDQMSATIREDVIREALLADCSDEDVERAKSRFVPQAVAPFATPLAVTEENFGRVPRVYIETLQDRAVSPWFQKEMYERLPCQNVVSMETSHSPFFSAPEELAGHLEFLARA